MKFHKKNRNPGFQKSMNVPGLDPKSGPNADPCFKVHLCVQFLLNSLILPKKQFVSSEDAELSLKVSYILKFQ